MESHWEYFAAIPQTFQHFGDAKDLDLGSLLLHRVDTARKILTDSLRQ